MTICFFCSLRILFIPPSIIWWRGRSDGAIVGVTGRVLGGVTVAAPVKEKSWCISNELLLYSVTNVYSIPLIASFLMYLFWHLYCEPQLTLKMCIAIGPWFSIFLFLYSQAKVIFWYPKSHYLQTIYLPTASYVRLNPFLETEESE